MHSTAEVYSVRLLDVPICGSQHASLEHAVKHEGHGAMCAPLCPVGHLIFLERKPTTHVQGGTAGVQRCQKRPNIPSVGAMQMSTLHFTCDARTAYH